MFQSVIEEGHGWRSGRLGTGTGVSVLVHAGLLGAVLLLSSQVTQEAPEPVVDLGPLKLVAPPRGNPTPPQVATQVTPRRHKPRHLVPRQVPPPPVQNLEPVKDEPPPAPDAPPARADLPYIPGSDPNGVEKGGLAGVPLPPVLANLGAGGGEDVLPFGEGMRPPELLSDPSIELPREALLARVEGSVIIKCVITWEGEVEACRILKGLSLVNQTVLSALEARRYRPVLYQGRPVSVSYTFRVHIQQPR